MPKAITWTKALEQSFADGIIEGTSIEEIARKNNISPVSFYRHRVESEEFERTIVRAQEASLEREMDGLIALADTADEDSANAVKLKVWTRMWVAGKRKPKKYGEKIQQEVSGELGIKTIVVQPDAKQSKPKAEVKPEF